MSPRENIYHTGQLAITVLTSEDVPCYITENDHGLQNITARLLGWLGLSWLLPLSLSNHFLSPMMSFQPVPTLVPSLSAFHFVYAPPGCRGQLQEWAPSLVSFRVSGCRVVSQGGRHFSHPGPAVAAFHIWHGWRILSSKLAMAY